MRAPGANAAAGAAAEQRWKRLVDAASIAAGVAAYVYVAGGAVVYFSFVGAGLPASTIVAELPARRLLLVGLVLIAVGVPVVAALSLLLRAAINRAAEALERLEAWGQSDETASHWRGRLRPHAAHDFAAGPGDGILGALDYVDVATRGAVKGAARLAPRLAAAVGALVGFLLLAPAFRSSTPTPEVAVLLALLAASLWALAVRTFPFLRELDPRSGTLVRYTTVFAALATLVGACYVAYQHDLTLPRAVVLSTSGRCVTGHYLAHDAQGVHLVDGRTRSLAVIPSAQVSSTTVGSASAVFGEGIASVPCPLPLREAWQTLAPQTSP